MRKKKKKFLITPFTCIGRLVYVFNVKLPTSKEMEFAWDLIL